MPYEDASSANYLVMWRFQVLDRLLRDKTSFRGPCLPAEHAIAHCQQAPSALCAPSCDCSGTLHALQPLHNQLR